MNSDCQDIKIAVVGAGDWGRKLIREFSKFNVVKTVCYKGSQETREWLRVNYPTLKHTTNIEDVLSDDDLNSLVIATPINTHYELALKALNKGKNVFIEKPPVETIQQLEELYLLGEMYSLVIYTDHIFLHHPLFDEFKKLVGINGAKKLKFEWIKMGSFVEDIYQNLAYHEIYLAVMLFGIPKKVNLEEVKSHKTGADVIRFSIKFHKGRSASFYINRLSEERGKHISFDNENSFVIWVDNSILEIRKDGSRRTLAFTEDRPLSYVCGDFLKAIKSGASTNKGLVKTTLEVVNRLRDEGKTKGAFNI